jgi:hypothetical protein
LGDESVLHEPAEFLIERIHMLFRRAVEHVLDLVRFRLVDEVRDRRIIDHHFMRGDKRPVHFWNEKLRDDSREDHGELHANLRLLVRRKNIDDAINGFRCAVRVERGEDEVAGFRERDHGINRFERTHFSDENNVRILAKHMLQPLFKRQEVRSVFALGDDGLF